MLQYFRDHLTGAFAFVLFSLLIIPFAFVGIDSYFKTVPDNAVAKVNKAEITTNDFQTSWQRYQQQLRASLGANYDPETFDTLIARRGHLDAMIKRELLRQYAIKMGLAVSSRELSESIRSIPAFQIEGKFNPDLYQRILSSQGMTVRGFERDMANDMVISQIPATVMSSSIALEHEVNTLVALKNQKRSFESAIIPSAAFADQVEISEDQIRDWYAEHTNEYLSEEQVELEYVELNVADYKSQVTVDDEALKKQFENQKARFITPERRLASHILLVLDKNADAATTETVKQKAADLAKRARAGEDFAELAKENSDDTGSAPNGGDLGWVEPGVMVPAFEEALYGLSQGAVSDPVKTGFGFHIIQLRQIEPSKGMSFDEAKDQLKSEYANDAADKLYLEQANRLVDLVYEDPTTLATASEELGLEIKTTEPFGRKGGMGIAANPEVIKAAFSELVLQEGASSEPIEIEPNHVVVIRVKTHLQPEPRPLAEVKDAIASQLKLAEGLKQAQEKADELVAAVTSGAQLKEQAEANGFEYQRVENAGRQDVQYDLSLINQLFKLAVTDTQFHALAVSTGYAVIHQTDVVAGTLNGEAEKNQFIQAITNSAAVVENAGVLDWLEQQAEINIDESKLGGINNF